MDSYDNDLMLMALDDDLFWHEGGEEQCGECTNPIQ